MQILDKGKAPKYLKLCTMWMHARMHWFANEMKVNRFFDCFYFWKNIKYLYHFIANNNFMFICMVLDYLFSWQHSKQTKCCF